MNSLGPNHPLVHETKYRMLEIQREAKLATLRKHALQANAQPSLFSRLTHALTALVTTARVETLVMISDENLNQPVLKRSTATVSKV